MTDDEGFDLSVEGGEDHSATGLVDGHDYLLSLLDSTEDRVQPDVVLFQLAGRSLGVRAEHVLEVMRSPPVTALPGLPPHVQGVATRRRHVISVLDLARFFHLAATNESPASDTRVIVVAVDNMTVGILVDTIVGLEAWQRFKEAEADLDPMTVPERFRGVTLDRRYSDDEPVLLLDVERIVRDAAVGDRR